MKVLIAEDDPINSRLLKTLLFKWGYDIVTVSDGLEAWKIVQQENGPQMAIMDWGMPGLDGLEVCRRLREFERSGDRYTYVIMLTGRSDKEDLVTGIDAGADEYITKPFDTKELQARLHTGKRIIELHGALRAANKKLLFMSRLDSLTGALSRNAILDDLDLAFYRSTREKKPLCVVLVDVDHLKQINERYGRQAGDYVLQDCVRTISGCLRRTDSFGRLGSDRFLVILPGVDNRTGMIVCERIRNAVRGKAFQCGDQILPVTVSQSLALWDGKINIETLITLVENTHLATKPHGTNRLEKVCPDP
ncbi:MAG: response regulator [Deltaproteobacteria bacterium]|nr:response regulator [Deltaproteobacteria bacterium]